MTRVIALIIWALALVGMFLATAHRDPVAQGTLRTSSLIVDDLVQVGSAGPAAVNSKFRVNGIATAQNAQLWIDDGPGVTGHTGTGVVESVGIVIAKNTGFDTTGGDGVTRAIEIGSTCSVTSGPGACTAVGLQVSATDTAWLGLAGLMQHNDEVNFAASPRVQLGPNVDNFRNPGIGGAVPTIDLGCAPSANGMNIHVANTVTSLAGYQVGLDTTVAANARGGLLITRGAGGNFAGDNAGLVVAGDALFPVVGAAAGDAWTFNGQGGKTCRGTPVSGNGFTGMECVTPNNHVEAWGATPTKSAACDAGGGSAITGNDSRTMITMGATATDCVITYAKTFTVQPMVLVQPYGVAQPTCTFAAGAITCTVVTPGATYVFDSQAPNGGT